MRFFNRRFIVRALALLIIAVAAVITGVVVYFDSPAFEARARRTIIGEIERRTGAAVTLKDFDWSFWQRRFRLEGLVLRGLEPEYQTPLASFGRIDIGLDFWTLVHKRIDLYELTITRPLFHLVVFPDGKTNIPSPPPQPDRKPLDFQIAIDNFNIMDGSAILNERRINLDLSLQNLFAVLKYHVSREVLEAHLRYDGVVDRAPDVKLAIPYTLSADLDYTRATILVQRMLVTSGRNEVRLQGRVNQILSSDLAGKLSYTGSFQVPFLNYFFEAEKFAGGASASGTLEFARGKFFTTGSAKSDAIEFEGWRPTAIVTDYTYQYPDRLLSLKNLKSAFAGGSLAGQVAVEKLPGPSRVLVDINYANIDTAAMRRAYPWDRKYRIYSNASGTLNGWLEGKLARFDFSGHVDLKSYSAAASPEIVALPLDGAADFDIVPKEARVENANLRFNSTAVQASGRIHEAQTQLTVAMGSADLKDLSFIYPDANGSGTFMGSVSGALAKPLLDGQFTLQNHVFRDHKIEEATGSVRLDLPKEEAVLRDVHVKQGQSEVVIDGATALSGSPVDLRLRSDRVLAEDVRPFLTRDIAGIFAGDLRVTRLTPTINLEGDFKADNLAVDGRLIGNASGRVRYADPAIDLDGLSVRQGNSTLTGNLSFNRATEAVRFRARVNAVDFAMFYPLGLPDFIQGTVRQADLRGEGTLQQPNLNGTAAVQNLVVKDQRFPEAQVEFTSAGTKLDANVSAGKNLGLRAQIDTAARGYPFTARATFTQYHLEELASFSKGTIVATGIANLSGLLTDSDTVRGDGRIDSAEVQIQGTLLRPAKPFTFGFNASELTLGDVTVTGPSTYVTLAGAIGLRDPSPLNVKVNGEVDMKLIESQFPGLLSTGTVNLQVDVRGTVQAPDLRGTATLQNASLRKEGLFTGLTGVSGTMSFNQNQVRVNSIDGTAGGGTVHAEGTAVLQGGTIQNLAIQIDTRNVRLRGYPEGLRTVIDSRVTLRGTLEAPLLEGNIQIQSLAYRSTFEEFLAMMSADDLGSSPSELGHLRLSLHVEGGRNITIQNQLAEVEARVDIDVKGTVDEPAVTGHVEASGGTLLFQGNRYTVTRGNIDFVDPLKIEPVIDIEAESQVRDYRIILAVTGRGSNPKLAMRSDPPLPELEIVSLIAGGRTREEIAERSDLNRNVTSEQLFQSGAASILFDLLQQRVGNRLGLLGTGRVRIDPFLVGAETNTPGARITLSEQVTKDLSVTYSQDLASNRQQVITVEYFVSRNTSIVASRDELGNFGLDIRHRTRLK